MLFSAKGEQGEFKERRRNSVAINKSKMSAFYVFAPNTIHPFQAGDFSENSL
jgi:hypothetical protein